MLANHRIKARRAKLTGELTLLSILVMGIREGVNVKHSLARPLPVIA